MARKTNKKAAGRGGSRRAGTGGRRGRPEKTPSRVKGLAAALVLVLVIGIAVVKVLQTPWGKVLLVDAGFSSYYAEVQERIDAGLGRVLREAGLGGRLGQRVVAQVVGDERVLVREWEALCEPPCRFVEINLALTRAVKAAGAVVRAGSEIRETPAAEPDGLFFEAGSRRYPTHRVTIVHKPRSAALPRPVRRPRLALVIDDFGYAKSDIVEAFMAIDLPLTLAVIPSLPHTRYAISRARDEEKQAILHLPMEAEHYEAERPMVLTTMDSREISSLVDRFLKENPGVVGINNHLGSLATQDERVMDAVLSVVKAHGLFFLDSLTSAKSIAYNTARALGVPAARNDLFLDADTEDPLVVEERLLRLLDIARLRGSAVGIGHPRQWTYQAITRNEGVLRSSGVELVFVSELAE